MNRFSERKINLILGALLTFTLLKVILWMGGNQLIIINTRDYLQDPDNLTVCSEDEDCIIIRENLEPEGVIFHPQGGIGNQLYQYACLYALARDRKLPLHLRVNMATLNSDSSRQFLPQNREFVMDQFEIPLENFVDNGTFINPELVTYIDDIELLFRSYENRPYLKLAKNYYCQSEAYWAPYKDDILDMFQLRPEVVQNFPEYVRKIEEDINSVDNSVCVHVRRGDFSTKDNILPITYQRWAIQKVNQMLFEAHGIHGFGRLPPSAVPKFFVFSDDIEYVREELKDLALFNKVMFVSADSPNRTTSLEDFYLMSFCKHFIIPNSTFGWWVAYLSTERKDMADVKEDRIVIISEFLKVYWDNFKKKKKYKLRRFYRMLHDEAYYPKNWIVFYPYKYKRLQ